MKRAGVRVGTGTRFLYDGEVIEIVKIHCVGGAPEVVARHVRTETVCRLALNELMFSQQLIGPDLDGEHIFEPDDAPGITQQQIGPLRRSW
jgi:hypothetical protein